MQNIINHVALVLDRSWSMTSHAQAVVTVADQQIAYLARRSQELNQETRVSVYSFGDNVQNLIFDMDVLRLPSIETLYRIEGNTALCAATLKGLDDLETTSTIYGDHSFLMFVLTDGEENRSSMAQRATLPVRLKGLPVNWTVAGLVPDQISKMEAQRFGFPAANLAVWDTASARGMAEAGDTIRTATDNFMAGRAKGVRGTRNLFDTSAARVNTATVQQALKPLAGDKYRLIPVEVGKEKVRADEFVRDHCGIPFVIGNVYYQWSKKETVQPQKRLAVVNKKTDQVFVGTGDEIRDLIGLPSMRVRDVPKANPDYQIFVQSTAPNRNLIEHTKALVML